MSKPLVNILVGSASDLEVMQEAERTLKEFGVPCALRVMSAHRTPEDVRALVSGAKQAGAKVFIAGAGMAAHLAGAVAAQTPLPVIGVPLPGSALNGFDALLSTVQMPKGMPVATVAIGKAGAVNAALLAVQMLCLAGDVPWAKFEEYRARQTENVRQEDAKLHS